MHDLLGRVTGRIRSVGSAVGSSLATRNGRPPSAITALDVGTEFAKVLVVGVEEDAEGNLSGSVLGAARRRQGLTHMQSGTVSDIDAVVENCAAALGEAASMAGARPTAAAIGIAGELVKGVTASRVVRRADARAPLGDDELRGIVERVQREALREAEERIAWESGIERLDVRLVHAAIVEMKIDGYEVSNPIGFTGAQVELSLFNAFAPMVHLGALQSVAGALNLRLLGVIVEPYAVATCLGPGELGEAGAVFVDIGGGTTDVALVRHGGIVGTKMLALGGRAFTKGVAERFALPFDRAEALKLAAAAGGLFDEEVSRDDVEETLLDDARVWLRGVELMIDDLAGGELLPGRIYLCGGGADLPQIGTVLREGGWWQRLPFARQPQVRALAPAEVTGLVDETDSLRSRQDVTPLALARQALILDARTSAAERAMRHAVRTLRLQDR